MYDNKKKKDEEKKKSVCFSLDNKKIYTATSWKPSISIWDGIKCS